MNTNPSHSMFETQYWWPIELSDRERSAVGAFSDQMSHLPIQVNVEKAHVAIELLDRRMQRHVGEIVDRDGLPHLCHIINGWGDARFRNRVLSEYLDIFVHRDEMGRSFILQCDPEGDFHPWQTFAYLVMAGAEPDAIISSVQASLRTIALNSRRLNTEKHHDLGHFLFTLAFLDPDPNGEPFWLKDTAYTVAELLDLGIHAHHYGSFEVCRKFHLTEGICAMAARVPEFAVYRPDAQGFLEGQLGMLVLLGTILREARELANNDKPADDDGLITELRRTLVMGDFIENHYYYAGHVIELALLAAILGYDIRGRQWNTMVYVINELNSILPQYLPYTSFPDCFLHFAHYRRALTLFLEHACGRIQHGTFDRTLLKRYAIDFDTVSNDPLSMDLPESSPLIRGIYSIAEPSNTPRPEFELVINYYDKLAGPGLQPRGGFAHFRRIGPPTWPRAIHYELLDYGDRVGIEIHLESKAVLPLRPLVGRLVESVSEHFPNQLVGWDNNWYNECGRLCVIFDESASPTAIAQGMLMLIQETFPKLDPSASALRLHSM